jgi:hypothetical protein
MVVADTRFRPRQAAAAVTVDYEILNRSLIRSRRWAPALRPFGGDLRAQIVNVLQPTTAFARGDVDAALQYHACD